MLNIIDRYIAKHFLGFLVTSLGAFVCIYLVVDFLSLASRFDASGKSFLAYYLCYLPSIVLVLLPPSALIATMFSLNGFNRSNELGAMFSSGMSLARISTPILVVVGLLSLVGFFISDKVLPILEKKKNYIYYFEIKKEPWLYSTVKSSKIWYRSGNILYNIQTLNKQAKVANGVSFFYFDELWNLLQVVSAERAEMIDTKWRLFNGKVSLFEGQVPVSRSFNEKVITLQNNIGGLQEEGFATDVLSARDLKIYIERNQAAGLDTLAYEVDYHAKFSSAFIALVLCLLGIPFSVGNQRSGGLGVNIAICMGLSFLYWALSNSSITLAKHAVLYPFLGAWGPNLLGFLVSILLLIRLRR